jgi:CRISPR-associated protein Cas8a1/Csx13
MALMILKLSDSGMTSLHKAGLAGLYMTLKAFDENQIKIEGLNWKLEDKQITLDWTESSTKKAFTELIDKSFSIDEDGFLRLYGLEPERKMNKEQKYLLYKSILLSFLQFGPIRKTGSKRPLVFQSDQDTKPYIENNFAPLTKIPQQELSNRFFNSKGEFNDGIEIKGWLHPGAITRHELHNKETTLTEPLNLGMALVFAPVGVIYYLIQSKAKGRKAKLALLIPEIKNLRTFSEARQFIASQGVFELTASSSSDAALRMLVTLNITPTISEFAEELEERFLCRVITFGIVDWNDRQKTRTSTKTIISGKLRGFENYKLATQIFKNKWQQVQEKGKVPEHFFVSTFCGREMVADNIANSKTWYHNISEFLANRETREQLIKYELKELRQMVKEASYENENERLFIEVCQEGWRIKMGKLGERASRENMNFYDLIDKEREKLRTSIGRCKNASLLRETVIDFWSRAGSIKQLQGAGWSKVLQFFDDDWRKAKDLTLLALISYQSPEKNDDTISNTEGENQL